MAILITGGAGYIGSHTALFLQEQEEEVVILDNLDKGHSQSVLLGSFYEGQLTDGDLLTHIVTEHEIEAVIHLAASSLVGESVHRPFDYYANNVLGTHHL